MLVNRVESARWSDSAPAAAEQIHQRNSGLGADCFIVLKIGLGNLEPDIDANDTEKDADQKRNTLSAPGFEVFPGSSTRSRRGKSQIGEHETHGDAEPWEIRQTGHAYLAGVLIAPS